METGRLQMRFQIMYNLESFKFDFIFYNYYNSVSDVCWLFVVFLFEKYYEKIFRANVIKNNSLNRELRRVPGPSRPSRY